MFPMAEWVRQQGPEALEMGSNPSIYIYILLYYYDFEF